MFRHFVSNSHKVIIFWTLSCLHMSLVCPLNNAYGKIYGKYEWPTTVPNEKVVSIVSLLGWYVDVCCTYVSQICRISLNSNSLLRWFCRSPVYQLRVWTTLLWNLSRLSVEWILFNNGVQKPTLTWC